MGPGVEVSSYLAWSVDVVMLGGVKIIFVMCGIENVFFVMYGRSGSGLYVVGMVLKKSPRDWVKWHEFVKKTYKSNVADEA